MVQRAPLYLARQCVRIAFNLGLVTGAEEEIKLVTSAHKKKEAALPCTRDPTQQSKETLPRKMTNDLKDLEKSLPPLPKNLRNYRRLERGMDLDQGISLLVVNERAALIVLALGQSTLVPPPVEIQTLPQNRWEPKAVVNTKSQEPLVTVVAQNHGNVTVAAAMMLSSPPRIIQSPHLEEVQAKPNLINRQIMNALEIFKTQYQIYSAQREAQDYLTIRGMLEQRAATQTLLVMIAGAGGMGDLCNTWNPRLTLNQLQERERAQEEEFLRVATGHPPMAPYVSQGGTLSPMRDNQ
ncbi:uncharacterized protein VP01_4463g1 [Puccinia sorghi]|uniref:Uncharacterized protein n=1 Tax=Puccinia sorghi TaxID=27349 RepID=A0A0L6UPB9_9BASI|nr:uncharacterized protein VP01_4463g1 [Puccinia sorghi]